MAHTLYRVSIRVRPAPEHPLYWELEFGYLQIWLFGSDPSDALDKATRVAGALPYELVGDQAVVYEDTVPPAGTEGAIQCARTVGLGLYLAACKVGTEEGGFADEPR